MANIAFQRLQREFREVVTSDEIKSTGIKLEAVDDQLTTMSGEVRGPPDTPYADGIFKLDIRINDTYPFKPPQVKFQTHIWHPNVSSQTGAICLDILKDQWAASMTLRTVLLSIQALLAAPEPNDPQDAVVKFQTQIWHPNVSSQTGAICLDILKDQWAASMTLRTVLLSIQALLAAPEPNDPQDAVVAKQFISENAVYKATARTWAQTYANAPGDILPVHIDSLAKLTDMGITRDQALTALSTCYWDVARATERIFS